MAGSGVPDPDGSFCLRHILLPLLDLPKNRPFVDYGTFNTVLCLSAPCCQYVFLQCEGCAFSVTILLWIPVTSFVSGYRENAWEANKRLFILAGLGMMLLRNNGIYVFIVMLMGLVLLMKRIRMNLLLTGLVMIAVSITPDVAIKQILNLPQPFSGTGGYSAAAVFPGRSSRSSADGGGEGLFCKDDDSRPHCPV